MFTIQHHEEVKSWIYVEHPMGTTLLKRLKGTFSNKQSSSSYKLYNYLNLAWNPEPSISIY